MANRYDIIRIDFQASAKGANAAIESIRKEAQECNNEVDKLKAKIAEGVKTNVDKNVLEGWQNQLRSEERRFKQFSNAEKELIKGMRVLDQAVKMFNDGSLSSMNAAFQKAANNAAKLAQSKLATGSKEWREMGAVMQETEQNYARMQRDTDQLIQSLQNGGTVFRKTLEDEKKGLQDLLQVLPYMGTEYRKTADQLDFLDKKTEELIVKERQMKGEIVTVKDAYRVANQLTKEGADAARQRADAAEREIENGKRTIAELEEEKRAREENARASADAAAKFREDQQMHEDELARIDKEIEAEQRRADSKRNGIEALKNQAKDKADIADGEIKKQKELDSAYDAAKEKTEKIRAEYEQMKQSVAAGPTKDATTEAIKAGAEEASAAIREETEEAKRKTAATKESATAKEQETEATEKNAEAAKEEVKVGEEQVKTIKAKADSVEELRAKYDEARNALPGLYEEEKKLIAAQEKGTKATNEQASAFSNLTKEQAKAMLEARQKLSTFKVADGKTEATNVEEAQQFIFDTVKKINPKGVRTDRLELEGGKQVEDLVSQFQSRYGLQSADEAHGVIRSLISGEQGGLAKKGFMNKFIFNVEQNTTKISAYGKEMSLLTEIVEGNTQATEKNAQSQRTLEQVQAEIAEKERIQLETSKLLFGSKKDLSASTDKETETLESNTEAKKRNAEATKAQLEAIKAYTPEQAEAAKKQMMETSTIGFKGGKIDMSNPEQVQHFLISKILKKAKLDEESGMFEIRGSQVDDLLADFQKKYGFEGDKQTAKTVLKDIIKGNTDGGMIGSGGSVDFNRKNLRLDLNQGAYQRRIDTLKNLISITNSAKEAERESYKITENGKVVIKEGTKAKKEDVKATEEQTDALKKQEQLVESSRKAYEAKNQEYEEKKAELAKKRQRLNSLPKGGTDAELERSQLNDEIKDYDANVVGPARREASKLKKSWQKSAERYAQMAGIQDQETEATKKSAAADEQAAEASEKKTRSRKKSAEATKEDSEAERQLAEKAKELQGAEAEEAKALKEKEAQQNKTNKAVNDSVDANKKADEADRKHVQTMKELNDERQGHVDGLAKLNDENRETIANNEKNQQLLAETNGKMQEQVDKIREAERIKAQAQTNGIEKTEQAIRILTEQNRGIDTNSEQWKKNTAVIQQLQAALAEMKNQPALQLMTERMQNVGSLSNAAVTETRKFWQAMYDGAEKNDPKLKEIEQNLKNITAEEQKRNREALSASANRLGENLGNLSSEELRKSIADAKTLQGTYKETSREARELANQILNAEEYAKNHGIEAMRQARKEQEATRLQEQQQRELAATMTSRLHSLKTLSADATAEARRYWEAQRNGAEEGTAAFRKAEVALSLIDKEQAERTKVRNEQLARRLERPEDFGNYTTGELKESIDAAKQLALAYKSGSDEAVALTKNIVAAEEHVGKYSVEAERSAKKQADALREMEDALRKAQDGQYETASMQVLEDAIKKLKAYQATINDPEGTGKETFDSTKNQIDSLTAKLNTLKGVAESVKSTFANADDVVKRFGEHMASSNMDNAKQQAQAMEEKLAATTSVFDQNIKDAAWDVDHYEQQLKEATSELEQMEHELAELEKKHASSSWFRKQTSAYKRETWRINDLKKAIGGDGEDESEFGSTAKGRVDFYREAKNRSQEVLDHYKRLKAETLGLNDAEEQLQQTRRMTKEEMQEGIKVLEAEAFAQDRTTEDGKKRFEELRSTIDQMNQELKESTGEWMSFAQAEKMASTAGTDDFHASLDQIQKATQAIERRRDALIKSTNAIRENKNATAEEKAELDKEEKELAELADKLRNLKFEQDNFNMSHEKMKALIKTPAAAVNLEELRSAIKRADDELRLMKGSLGENSEEYKNFASQVKNAKNVLKEMEGQSKATASSFEKAWSRLKTYITLYVSAAAALQKLMGTLGDIHELSDKMGEVRKTTGFTADEVGRLSSNLAKLDTRTSLTSLMEVSAKAGQLGLKTMEDVQGFTEAANMLMVAMPELGAEAATEMLKVATATGEVNKIRKQLEQGVVEGSSATAVAMEKIGSTIDRLRATSAAAAPAITDFIKRVGAVGAQSGLTIDQVAALGATVDALGMRVEMSATALSRMIPAIKNNAYQIGAMIGKTEEEIKTKFSQEGGGMEVILDVFEAMRDKTGALTGDVEADAENIEKAFEDAGFGDIMKQLNQQGARAGIVFAGLSKGVDELRKNLVTAADAYEENIAILNEYNKMNDTTAAKWERFKNQIEEAFVGDRSQKFLGWIIDRLRNFVDLLVGDVGPALKFVSILIRTFLVYWGIFKVGLGEAIFVKAIKGLKAMGTGLTGLIGQTQKYILYSRLMNKAQLELKMASDATSVALAKQKVAAIEARMAQEGLNKAMIANVWAALITAVASAVYWLVTWEHELTAAERAVDSMNGKIADEKEKIDNLNNAYKMAEGNTNKRKVLMEEMNKSYGKYLGFLLTDAENTNLMAMAHERAADAMEREILMREKQQGVSSIRQDKREDLAKDWATFTDELRKIKLSSEEIGRVQIEVQKILKNIKYDEKAGAFQFPKGTRNAIDQYLASRNVETRYKDLDTDEIIATLINRRMTEILPKTNRPTIDYVTGIGNNGGSSDKWSRSRRRNDFVGNYVHTWMEMTEEIGKFESEVNGRIAASDEQRAEHTKKHVDVLKKAADDAVKVITGNNATSEQIAEAYKSLATAINGLKAVSDDLKLNPINISIPYQAPVITASDVDNIINAAPWNQQKVDQERLEKAIQRQQMQFRINNGINDDNNDDNNDRGPRGPYGNYDKRVDPYEQWDANALVKRREDMLKRVRALANGADVQKVLSLDKKFMDEATRKGIKNMRDAIAWYNEERLKIQEELHSRNLTNTGDWMDPKKESGRKRKPKTPESEEAIAELDRYYSERKEKIEEARVNEEMTEAEYNRRIDALEQEHLQKRSDLRTSFTTADKQFVADFRQWWASVADLDEVSWETIEAEWKAAWERDRAYNKRAAQKDLTDMRAIVVKQLKEIEAVIDKERPFNGITKNLQENLTKMGIMFMDGVEGTMKESVERTTFLLKESENAYEMTWEQLEKDMRENGFGAWADAVVSSENAEKTKRAMINALHTVYDDVQDAIKKEAAQVKKQVDITWSDAILPNGKSIKQTYEAAISALGVTQGRVSRANSLIGAGQASERVADKLAIKQLQVQLRMQEHYYNLIRMTGQRRIDDLKRQAEEQRKLNNLAEAERLELDAKHATMSLNLSLAKEQTELDKQREEIIARTEESQARLYKELREWGDLLASSLQAVMEASNAGNAEYYNELAKLELTGKGGPGAGTYVIIENEGTENAKAHYEYLDEREALVRQREIEQQNAQADAWKKLMDDLNQKMSDTITDQLNAMLQNASIDANTKELENLQKNLDDNKVAEDSNTIAVKGLTGAVTGLTEQMKESAKTGAGSTEGKQDDGTDTVYYDIYLKTLRERSGQPSEEIPASTGGNDNVPEMLRRPEENVLPDVGRPWSIPDQGEWMAPLAPPEVDTEAVVAPWAAFAEASMDATKTVIDDNKKIMNSTQATFAKMALAANLYGVAYQAVTNDNLSAQQKFEMIALQSVGNFAISSLTAFMAEAVAKGAVDEATVLGKLWSQLGWAAAPVFAIFTGLLGAAMGAATNAVSKSKSQIAQATGSSASAGRLSTGMLTYAEGNVNEFTDPSTLTPGRSYNVDGADGRTYRAKYMGKDARTHITNGPEFHLVGEKGREAIIDAHTTRLLQMDDTGIWSAIQTLYNGGSVHSLRRRGVRRGMPAFADGNLDDFYEAGSDAGAGDGATLGFDPAAMQASLDRNSEVQEALLQRLSKPITVSPYGPDGIVAAYDKYKKEATRHGVRYE